MNTKSYYENGECPDCSENIPDDCDSGDECHNCGHVFWSKECGECGNKMKTYTNATLKETYGCPNCD